MLLNNKYFFTKVLIFFAIFLLPISCCSEVVKKESQKEIKKTIVGIITDTTKPKNKEVLPSLKELKQEYLGKNFVSNKKKFKKLLQKAEKYLETKFDEHIFLSYLQEEFSFSEDSLDKHLSKLSKQELNDTLYYLMGSSPHMMGMVNSDDFEILYRKSIGFGIQKKIYKAFNLYSELVFRTTDMFLEEKDRKKRAKQYLLYALANGNTEAVIVFLDYWDLISNYKIDEDFAIRWLEYAAYLDDRFACGRLSVYYKGEEKIFNTQEKILKDDKKHFFYNQKFESMDSVNVYIKKYEQEKDSTKKFNLILKAYLFEVRNPHKMRVFQRVMKINEIMEKFHAQEFKKYLKDNRFLFKSEEPWSNFKRR